MVGQAEAAFVEASGHRVADRLNFAALGGPAPRAPTPSNEDVATRPFCREMVCQWCPGRAQAVVPRPPITARRDSLWTSASIDPAALQRQPRPVAVGHNGSEVPRCIVGRLCSPAMAHRSTRHAAEWMGRSGRSQGRPIGQNVVVPAGSRAVLMTFWSRFGSRRSSLSRPGTRHRQGDEFAARVDNATQGSRIRLPGSPASARPPGHAPARPARDRGRGYCGCPDHCAARSASHYLHT